MMKKTALITGASSGIGFEFARLFARAGYDLVLVSRNEEKLNQATRLVAGEFPGAVKTIAADLSDPRNAREVFNQTTALGIEPDVLVNNAGIGLNGEFVDNELHDELAMLHLNVTSLVTLCHLFGRTMAKRGSGKILNVASTAAFQPGPLMSNYYASKAYVLSFSQGLRGELKSRGVNVTTLCPGPTRTEFFERGGMTDLPLARAYHMLSAEQVAKIGYQALVAGKDVVVAGRVNRFLALAAHFAPRRVVVAMAHIMNQQRGTPALRDA